MHLSLMDAKLHADSSAQIGAVLHLIGDPPHVDELRTHVAARIKSVPAWGMTIAGRGDQARWAAVPLDLEHHVRSRCLPPGRTLEDGLVHELQHKPFSAERPQWDLTLLTGHAPGRYAIMYRVNHGLMDGAAVIRAAEVLFGPSQISPAQSAALAPGLSKAPKPSRLLVAATLAREVRAFAQSGPWRHESLTYSDERVSKRTTVPADLLRLTARPHGGTSNDVFLAALALTLSRWINEHVPGQSAGHVQIAAAVNVRRPDEIDHPGNRIGLANIQLPCSDTATPEHLRLVSEATGVLRSPTHRAAMYQITRHAPRFAVKPATRWFTSAKRPNVMTSYMALRHPMSFRGAPVHAVDPVTVLPAGCPLSVVLLRYQDQATAHFVSDKALPDLDTLNDAWGKAVHALADGLAHTDDTALADTVARDPSLRC
ncbi:wax ester/triacylglycerol synthase domain-containing protein [Streptomyces sp. NPDC048337]|uniref:wax ester/triacylglycerol synthase domain-containing protein n=1 Tax=Streptomyces sp. NPDC048337 TaxID=3365535 RepID=UPI0037127F88